MVVHYLAQEQKKQKTKPEDHDLETIIIIWPMTTYLTKNDYNNPVRAVVRESKRVGSVGVLPLQEANRQYLK